MLATTESARHAEAFDQALHNKMKHYEWCDGVEDRAAELGLRSLDEFMDQYPLCQPLETERHFERWYSGDEADESAWFCRDCGAESEHDDQCSLCGYGAPEDIDEPIF